MLHMKLWEIYNSKICVLKLILKSFIDYYKQFNKLIDKLQTLSSIIKNYKFNEKFKWQ